MRRYRIMVFALAMLVLLTSCEYKKQSTQEPAQSEDISEPSVVSSSVETNQSQSMTLDVFELQVKKGETTYQVEGCLIDAFSLFFVESTFPDQGSIFLSKEMIFKDEAWSMLVDANSEFLADASSELTLEFICGAYEDFDLDGKKESVILLGAPNSKVFLLSNYFYIYIDESNAICFLDSLEVNRFELLVFDDSICVKASRMWGLGMGAGEAIYTFEDGDPKPIFDSLGGRGYFYARGYISCYDYYKFLDWESIAIWDNNLKAIRELGIEKISKETFVSFFENGTQGLDHFEAMTGWSEYEIYTQGYVNFFLVDSNEHAYIFSTDENGQAKITDSPQNFSSHYLIRNSDYLYGLNANNFIPVYEINLSKETIERINQLAQKSETFGPGLTEDEQKEFENLKLEYIAATDR